MSSDVEQLHDSVPKEMPVQPCLAMLESPLCALDSGVKIRVWSFTCSFDQVC